MGHRRTRRPHPAIHRPALAPARNRTPVNHHANAPRTTHRCPADPATRTPTRDKQAPRPRSQQRLRHAATQAEQLHAIHLYYDLDETLASWARVLRPGGLAFVCSGNMRNPNGRPGEWIIDETVAKVNEIAADLVRTEPAFAEYRETLEDATLMSRHEKLREKVFVPVRPLDFYEDSFRDAGFKVLHVFEETIFA